MLTLLYDSQCGFCCRCVSLLARWDKQQVLVFRSLHVEHNRRAFGLTLTQASSKIHAQDTQGVVYSGALALLRCLDAVGGTQVFSRLYAIAPLAWLAEKTYTLIADNRSRFGMCAHNAPLMSAVTPEK